MALPVPDGEVMIRRLVKAHQPGTSVSLCRIWAGNFLNNSTILAGNFTYQNRYGGKFKTSTFLAGIVTYFHNLGQEILKYLHSYISTILAGNFKYFHNFGGKFKILFIVLPLRMIMHKKPDALLRAQECAGSEGSQRSRSETQSKHSCKLWKYSEI